MCFFEICVVNLNGSGDCFAASGTDYGTEGGLLFAFIIHQNDRMRVGNVVNELVLIYLSTDLASFCLDREAE